MDADDSTWEDPNWETLSSSQMEETIHFDEEQYLANQQVSLQPLMMIYDAYLLFNVDL